LPDSSARAVARARVPLRPTTKTRRRWASNSVDRSCGWEGSPDAAPSARARHQSSG
jgi:hypothetical protein